MSAKDKKLLLLQRLITSASKEISTTLDRYLKEMLQVSSKQGVIDKMPQAKILIKINTGSKFLVSNPRIALKAKRPVVPTAGEAKIVKFKQLIVKTVWTILEKLAHLIMTIRKNGKDAALLVNSAKLVKRVQEAILTANVLRDSKMYTKSTHKAPTPKPVEKPKPKPLPVAAEPEPYYDGYSDEEEEEEEEPQEIDFSEYASVLIPLEEIELKEAIGKGLWGAVYKAVYKGRIVAAKRIVTTNPEYIQREVFLLKEVSHKNIMEFIGISKQSPTSMLLISEYVPGGELYKALTDEKKPLSWIQMLNMALDVAAALAELHKKNIMHRDIKSENMLVDHDWNVKLCDFGFARKTQGNFRYTICGSLYFIAPEVILGKPYSLKADVFAYGIFVCELITRGKVAFDRSGPAGFILDLSFVKKSIPKDTPPIFWDLISQCCADNPESRPSMLTAKSQIKRFLLTKKL